MRLIDKYEWLYIRNVPPVSIVASIFHLSTLTIAVNMVVKGHGQSSNERNANIFMTQVDMLKNQCFLFSRHASLFLKKMVRGKVKILDSVLLLRPWWDFYIVLSLAVSLLQHQNFQISKITASQTFVRQCNQYVGEWTSLWKNAL